VNLPDAFIEKYQQLLGAQSTAFIASFNRPAGKGFRINPAKLTAVKPLVNTKEPIAYVENGYYGAVSGRDIVHTSGGVYSQEPSAMYVGAVVQANPGEMVLDLCAAPGGKSTHIGSQLAGEGLLVANEINPKRAKILAENIERFGLRNTVVTNNSPEQLAAVWPQKFDKILVDAPCSGEGMFRKDPEATQYWHVAYPAECARRQKDILQSALTMLKPGGTLVYSTCTFSPEEDEQVMAWLLATYPSLTAQTITQFPGMVAANPTWADDNPEIQKAVRLWPHLIRGEGHFIAKFQLQSDSTETITSPKKTPKKQRANTQPSKPQMAVFNDFVAQTFKQDPFTWGHLTLHGVYLHEVSDADLTLQGVKVLRNGLNLGTFKKNRFEPDHDLAVTLPKSVFKVQHEVAETAYQQYLHGDMLTLPKPIAEQKVFGLLTHEGLGFALGKFVNQQIKNFYPKGLRQ
jgi:NOL1/NOP2/sun family putative RNA methylase